MRYRTLVPIGATRSSALLAAIVPPRGYNAVNVLETSTSDRGNAHALG
jgi:hypothetical protein